MLVPGCAIVRSVEQSLVDHNSVRQLRLGVRLRYHVSNTEFSHSSFAAVNHMSIAIAFGMFKVKGYLACANHCWAGIDQIVNIGALFPVKTRASSWR